MASKNAYFMFRSVRVLESMRLHYCFHTEGSQTTVLFFTKATVTYFVKAVKQYSLKILVNICELYTSSSPTIHMYVATSLFPFIMFDKQTISARFVRFSFGLSFSNTQVSSMKSSVSMQPIQSCRKKGSTSSSPQHAWKHLPSSHFFLVSC